MITFTYPIVSYQCKTELKFSKLKLNTAYLLWWFGAVVKNPNNSENPLVQVLFRKIIKRTQTEIVLGDLVKEELSIAAISQYLIGSIWLNGKSSEIVDYPEVHVELSYQTGQWSVKSFNSSGNNDKPYFNELYPLMYGDNDYSKMLEFNTKHGEKLIVNCMEFYRASYGVSLELKRVLMTYPYQTSSNQKDSIKSILLPTVINPQANNNEWEVVKPSFRFVKEDSLFLAHLKYDTYTQTVIKKLANERIQGWLSHVNTSKNMYSFLSIEPWTDDNDVKMVAKGISIPNGFLALQIFGISEPHGNDILLHSAVSQSASALQSSNTNNVTVLTRQVKTNVIPVTSQFPSNWNAAITMQPIKVQVVEKNRQINVIPHASDGKPHARNGKVLPTGNVSQSFSTAPPKGNGEIGGIVSQVVVELSRFEKMWREAVDLKTKGFFKKVEWYDGNSFHEQEPIRGINLDNLSRKSSLVAKAFVMRLTDTNKRLFICIELTTRNNRDNFTGLLAEIEPSVSLATWIRWILREAVVHEGVFRKFVNKSIYKNYKVYKHTDSNEKISVLEKNINIL